MKFDCKMMLTATASAAIGARAVLGIQASINPLHAQMKPPSYA